AGRAPLRRRLRAVGDARPRNRAVPTPDLPVRGRHLSDGLPVALRLGRVRDREPGRPARHGGRLFTARLSQDAAGARGEADPVAAGLLARPGVLAERRTGSDSERAARAREGLHAVECRRAVHGQGALHARLALAAESSLYRYAGPPLTAVSSG